MYYVKTQHSIYSSIGKVIGNTLIFFGMQLRSIFSPKTIQMQVINIPTHCLTQKYKIAKCKSNYLAIPL